MAATKTAGAAVPKQKDKSENSLGTAFKKVKRWLRACMHTAKNIVWPAPDAVGKNFVLVLVTGALLTALIWGLDLIFSHIYQALLNLIIC